MADRLFVLGSGVPEPLFDGDAGAQDEEPARLYLKKSPGVN
jgi:hypothetical protein